MRWLSIRVRVLNNLASLLLLHLILEACNLRLSRRQSQASFETSTWSCCPELSNIFFFSPLSLNSLYPTCYTTPILIALVNPDTRPLNSNTPNPRTWHPRWTTTQPNTARHSAQRHLNPAQLHNSGVPSSCTIFHLHQTPLHLRYVRAKFRTG